MDDRAVPVTSVIKNAGADRYKLLYFYEPRRYELYKLSADIGEKNDLLEGTPGAGVMAIATDLRNDMLAWLAKMKPPAMKYRADGKEVPGPVPFAEATRKPNGVEGRLEPARGEEIAPHAPGYPRRDPVRWCRCSDWPGGVIARGQTRILPGRPPAAVAIRVSISAGRRLITASPCSHSRPSWRGKLTWPQAHPERPFGISRRLRRNDGWIEERSPAGTHQLPNRNMRWAGENASIYFLTTLDRGHLQVLPLAYDVRSKSWIDTTRSMTVHDLGLDGRASPLARPVADLQHIVLGMPCQPVGDELRRRSRTAIAQPGANLASIARRVTDPPPDTSG